MSVDYADMMEMVNSLEEQKIENLIMQGVINSASEYDPTADYYIDDFEDDFFNYNNSFGFVSHKSHDYV